MITKMHLLCLLNLMFCLHKQLLKWVNLTLNEVGYPCLPMKISVTQEKYTLKKKSKKQNKKYNPDTIFQRLEMTL